MSFDSDYKLPKGKIFTGVIVALVVIILIPIAIWGFNVLVSGPKGRGDQIRQVNTGTNRTEQYNHFYDLNAQYSADLGKIKIYADDLARFNKDNPRSAADSTGQIALDREQKEADVTGTESACVDVANTYNNDSRKTVTGAQFKAWDLPPSLNPDDCEA